MNLAFGLISFFLPVIIVGVIVIITTEVIVIGSAIWVHKDAKRYKAAGVNIMGAGAWSILVLLMWLPFFPIYLIIKFAKYNKQLQPRV